ncbi:HNH endonuclease [Vibrio fluvialis]|uniref:HNH endonuclease n=1 Tax=Vibrio fluvialis TaxID=676 RepID=UPI00192C209F|nr:hypothetical protein [Vibrio fluvialis]MBL4282197.1 hypothetical protein [Vibrio fluvialis]
MKKLPLPNYKFLNTFDVCLQDCTFENRDAMVKIRKYLLGIDTLYQQRASSTTLHLSNKARHGHSGDLVFLGVTKGDFVNLYLDCFAKAGSSGRVIYDALRASSNGLCPLCGIGSVSTLDHYLPKARYPLYSVLPCNLVPSCIDCNSGKGSTVLNSNIEEPLHPYFVSQHFIDEHWISADIVETKPVTAEFYPTPLATWSQDCQKRAVNHFKSFDLASRYKTQASLFFTIFTEQVRALKHDQGLSTVDIQADFIAKSQEQPPNSISRALMEAISRSEWFCSQQYL